MSNPDLVVKRLADTYTQEQLKFAYYFSILEGADEFVGVQVADSNEMYTKEEWTDAVIQFALVQLDQQDAIEESEVYQDLVKVYTTFFN